LGDPGSIHVGTYTSHWWSPVEQQDKNAWTKMLQAPENSTFREGVSEQSKGGVKLTKKLLINKMHHFNIQSITNTK